MIWQSPCYLPSCRQLYAQSYFILSDCRLLLLFELGTLIGTLRLISICKMSSLLAYSAIQLVSSCCLNVLSLEAIIRSDLYLEDGFFSSFPEISQKREMVKNRVYPSFGTLMTFTQFFTISLFCVPYMIIKQWPTKNTPKTHPVPQYHWIIMVILFWTSTMLNQWVVSWKSSFSYSKSNSIPVVPVPLHILIKSGGLIANMITGRVLLHRRYSRIQVVSVVLVSLGICGATLFSNMGNSSDVGGDRNELEGPALKDILTSITGTFLLLVTLFMNALLGLYQEWVYRGGKMENDWIKGLFYTHVYGLPFFILVKRQLLLEYDYYIRAKSGFIYDSFFAQALIAKLQLSSIVQAASSLFPTIRMPGIITKFTDIETLPFLLVFNALTQTLCIASVHKMSTKTSSLVVNLVLTLRKILSLYLSVWIFGSFNNQTSRESSMIWMTSAAFVFGGTILYSVSHSRDKQEKDKNQTTETEDLKKTD